MKRKRGKLKGFVSYAHKDDPYSELLINGLKNHLRESKIIDPNLWYDRLIDIGEEWNKTIQEQIKKCDFAILLLSINFLNSAFIKEKEFLQFLKRSEKDNFLFFPVYLNHFDLKKWPSIDRRQTFIGKGKDFGKPDNETIAYAELVDVNKVGEPLPNPYREKYHQQLADKIESVLLKYVNSEKKPSKRIHGNNFGKSDTVAKEGIEVFGIPGGTYKDLIGRNEALNSLEEWFARYQEDNLSFFVVIHGEPGIGKTHLSINFALSMKRMGRIRGNVYFVNSNYGDIKNSVFKLNAQLNVELQETLDDQSKQILDLLPSNSILILDNIGDYKGYQQLLSLKNIFVIINTQHLGLSPLRSLLERRHSRELRLSSLSDYECGIFFNKWLDPNILHQLNIYGYNWSHIICKQEQKSPFFLKQACKIIEDIFAREMMNIHQLISEASKAIQSEGIDIAEYAVDKLYNKLEGRRLLLACVLFKPSHMPFIQVLDTASLTFEESQSTILLAQDWGVLSHGSKEDDTSYLSMHENFHNCVRIRFNNEQVQIQETFEKRFVRTWFHFLVQSKKQDLFWATDDIRQVVSLMNRLTFRKDEALELELLNENHLWMLRTTLAPRECQKFLSGLLLEKLNPTMMPYILDGLAESFLRIGRLDVARIFAQQSLREFESIENIFSQVAALRRLGSIYRTMGKYKESLGVFNEAINKLNKSEKNLLIADIKRQVAQTYLEMGAVISAYEVQKDAVIILERLSEGSNESALLKNTLAYSLNTLGNIHLKLGQYEEAEKNIQRALTIHVDVVGVKHFYVGYDLRVLAKVKLKRGHIEESISFLEQSLEINDSFFGNSPNTAIVGLALAEAYMLNGNTDSAKNLAYRAKNMWNEEMDYSDKFIAFAHRILAEIFLFDYDKEREERSQQELLRTAEQHYQEAFHLLEEVYLNTPHMVQVRHIGSKIQLRKGEIKEAISTLWKIRSNFIHFGMLSEIKDVDNDLLVAILQDGIAEWNQSVDDYQNYLNNFPNSLHCKLGRMLIRYLIEEIKHNKDNEPQVIDVFCGTGFVSRESDKQALPNLVVTGIDGSHHMIDSCCTWKDTLKKNNYKFFHIPSEKKQLQGASYNFLTIHMGIFQIDLRARHFLFQKLLPTLDDSCTILFTTHSADFEFPDEIQSKIPKINTVNPFKEKLFEQFQSINYFPGSVKESIKPVFSKETLNNLSCFFELYGFDITPANIKAEDILKVERTWKDRITFTRIPVISKKVFGKIIPSDIWNAIVEPPEYKDFSYGIVIRAHRREQYPWIPHIFSHVDVDFTMGYEIRYAVAGILKNKDNKVLFLQRGEKVRDFQGAWSLSSSFAEQGLGLKESLYNSLECNLGIKREGINRLIPASIRFNLRETNGKKWIIAMCLFVGIVDELTNPELRTKKYKDLSWSESASFISNLGSKEIGDCIKSYRDLIRCGLLS